jgi:hypothetical protein
LDPAPLNPALNYLESSVEKQLDELVQAHVTLAAVLENGLLSPSTRRKLEDFREVLERDIALLRNNPEIMRPHQPLAEPDHL